MCPPSLNATQTCKNTPATFTKPLCHPACPHVKKEKRWTGFHDSDILLQSCAKISRFVPNFFFFKPDKNTPICISASVWSGIRSNTYRRRGTRQRIWLRHCVTSREDGPSIPDCVIWILHGHNPSGHTMALESTHPPVSRSDKLAIFICRSSWNVGVYTSRNLQGLSRPVKALLYLWLFSSKTTDSRRICW